MIRSVFSNWAGLFVLGAISVILTPILIGGLGPFYFGMWALVSSVLDYYGLLDLGMRWTLFRFVSRLEPAGQREALNQMLATALAATLAIGVILLGLSVILAPVVPAVFGVAGPARQTFQHLLVLLGFSVALSFPSHLLSAYLRGLQRFDLYNAALIMTALVRAVLLIGALRRGYGVLGVAVATLAVSVLGLFLDWKLVRRADPELSVRWRNVSRPALRQLLNYSFYAIVTSAGEHLRLYASPLIIGRLLGVAAVTPFHVAMRLLEYFRSIVAGVNGPTMARMGELDGQARSLELRRFFLRSTRMTALLSFFIAALLTVNGRSLIRLWVGEAFLSSYPLMLVLAAGYVVAYAQEPCRLVVYTQGRHHRALSWWTLAEGGANILLSIYWGRQYGLVGVAMGTAVPLAVVKLTVQPWYALRSMRITVWEYLAAGLGRPVLVLALFLAVCWLLAVYQRLFGPLELASSAACQALLFGLLTYAGGSLVRHPAGSN